MISHSRGTESFKTKGPISATKQKLFVCEGFDFGLKQATLVPKDYLCQECEMLSFVSPHARLDIMQFKELKQGFLAKTKK